MRLDIRVNDKVALSIASHFTLERVLVFTKRAVDCNNYTEVMEVCIEPGANPATKFDGKVIVIVSGSTVSAAIFIMTMAQLPQTTLLGRNTSGVLSDCLNRNLVLWPFNEIYAAPDGTIYEVDGIMPDVLPDAELFPLSPTGRNRWLASTSTRVNTVQGLHYVKP